MMDGPCVLYERLSRSDVLCFKGGAGGDLTG